MANARGDKKGFGEPFWGSGFLPGFVLDPPREVSCEQREKPARTGLRGRECRGESLAQAQRWGQSWHVWEKDGGRCGWRVVSEGEGREEMGWSALFQGQEKSSQGLSQRSERT